MNLKAAGTFHRYRATLNCFSSVSSQIGPWRSYGFAALVWNFEQEGTERTEVKENPLFLRSLLFIFRVACSLIGDAGSATRPAGAAATLAAPEMEL